MNKIIIGLIAFIIGIGLFAVMINTPGDQFGLAIISGAGIGGGFALIMMGVTQ